MIYSCPMHPEVKSDQPGKCSKCGMKLVLKSSLVNKEADNKGLGKPNYTPLIVTVGLILLTALIISYQTGFSLYNLISDFMIGFFIVFAGFKLIDLPGFAEGYSTYDLLAQRWFNYGYIYPVIELFFGLTMILSFHLKELLIAEIVVMSFSGLGVAIKLARHERFQCACLGTFLKVPLTKITLIEDFGMALLALTLLVIGSVT